MIDHQMKQRSPIAVFIFPIITLGIYSWYWLVKTKGEMNKLGEKIPTAWLWLIPLVGWFWWYWEYSKGVEHVTGEKIKWILAFVLLLILGNIGQAIIQDSFNKVVNTAPSTQIPVNPIPAYQPPVANVAVEDTNNQNQSQA
jgi:hypothetical protein